MTSTKGEDEKATDGAGEDDWEWQQGTQKQKEKEKKNIGSERERRCLEEKKNYEKKTLWPLKFLYFLSKLHT